MRRIALGLLTCVVLLTVSGAAFADFKLVKQAHTDGFSMMGQTQPAQDEERVTWIGENKLQVNTKAMSFIVLMEKDKMFFLQHDAKTYFELDLPLDLDSMLPPGMGEAMKSMMLTASVEATEETREIEGMKARKYNISLTSPMMNITTVTWATKDVDVDFAAVREMSSQMLSLQPNMVQVAEEMKKIEGVELESESTMEFQMGNTSVKSTEKLVSVEKLDAPAGTYEIPADYAKKEFNYMEMMKQGQ